MTFARPEIVIHGAAPFPLPGRQVKLARRVERGGPDGADSRPGLGAGRSRGAWRGTTIPWRQAENSVKTRDGTCTCI